ncbi:MAG: hypothetical protein M0R21_11550 [Lentimicrobiaceae bacterium]|nr:hypothetical protein [Lentimicrobiaceae bacterium]
MIIEIITVNIFGIFTAEWTGVGAKPKRMMPIGIILLVAAIIMLGLSMSFS